MTIPEVFNWDLINSFVHVVLTQVLESSNKYIEFVGLSIVVIEDSSLICRLEISYPLDDRSEAM